MKKNQPCNEDIRTLCPRCLAAYRDSGKFNIRRAKGRRVAAESCMICGKPNSAVDYIIIKRIEDGPVKRHLGYGCRFVLNIL